MNKNIQNLYGVILAGGAGTRLWPISRELYPKQLLKLFGDKTLIQQTFSRLKKIIPAGRIYVITTVALWDDVYFQLKGLGLNRENILIEPALKNTAPAIAFASQKILNRDKSAYVVACPADHLIEPDAKFAKAVKTALNVARLGYLGILGIVPTHPSSDFGYNKDWFEIQGPKFKTGRLSGGKIRGKTGAGGCQAIYQRRLSLEQRYIHF